MSSQKRSANDGQSGRTAADEIVKKDKSVNGRRAASDRTIQANNRIDRAVDAGAEVVVDEVEVAIRATIADRAVNVPNAENENNVVNASTGANASRAPMRANAGVVVDAKIGNRIMIASAEGTWNANANLRWKSAKRRRFGKFRLK